MGRAKLRQRLRNTQVRRGDLADRHAGRSSMTFQNERNLPSTALLVPERIFPQRVPMVLKRTRGPAGGRSRHGKHRQTPRTALRPRPAGLEGGSMATLEMSVKSGTLTQGMPRTRVKKTRGEQGNGREETGSADERRISGILHVSSGAPEKLCPGGLDKCQDTHGSVYQEEGYRCIETVLVR